MTIREAIETTKRREDLWGGLSEAEKNGLIKRWIIDASARMGQATLAPGEMGKRILELAHKDVFDYLEAKFKYVSVAEISYVFALGARGELGESIGIGAKTLVGWLLKYWKERRPEEVARLKAGAKPRKQLEAPKSATIWDMVEVVDEMVDNDKAPIYSAGVFDHLMEMSGEVEGLDFDMDFEPFMERGKARVMEWRRSKRESGTFKDKMALVIEGGEENEAAMAVRYAKGMAVHAWAVKRNEEKQTTTK